MHGGVKQTLRVTTKILACSRTLFYKETSIHVCYLQETRWKALQSTKSSTITGIQSKGSTPIHICWSGLCWSSICEE